METGDEFIRGVAAKYAQNARPKTYTVVTLSPGVIGSQLTNRVTFEQDAYFLCTSIWHVGVNNPQNASATSASLGSTAFTALVKTLPNNKFTSTIAEKAGQCLTRALAVPVEMPCYFLFRGAETVEINYTRTNNVQTYMISYFSGIQYKPEGDGFSHG